MNLCPKNQARIEELEKRADELLKSDTYIDHKSEVVNGMRWESKGIKKGATNERKEFLEWLNSFDSSNDGWRKIQDKIKKLESQQTKPIGSLKLPIQPDEEGFDGMRKDKTADTLTHDELMQNNIEIEVAKERAALKEQIKELLGSNDHGDWRDGYNDGLTDVLALLEDKA